MNPQGDSTNMQAGEDAGQPILLLTDEEFPPSGDFIGRVRRKIQRRTTASQIASYSWHMPVLVLLEMVNIFSHFLNTTGTKKESQR